jgi:large subunit ribosomal protein L4
MKTVTVYKRDGSEAGTIDLPDDIFGIEPSVPVLHQAIKAHLTNRRQGNASTKTRSEVNVTKSKPFRQKGTGRARSGSANSPVWVGGGTALGPKPRKFSTGISRKMKRLALKSAYSLKAADDRIMVVEDFTLDAPKTKDIAGMLKALKLDGGKTLFLYGVRDDVLYKSSRNIPKFNVMTVENAFAYEVMNSDTVLFTKTAVERIAAMFQGGESA